MGTLDEWLASRDPARWELVHAMIVSDQIAPHRVAEIFAAYPEFARWIREVAGWHRPLSRRDAAE